MARANSNAGSKSASLATDNEPLTAQAMRDLLSFLKIAKQNNEALAAWNEHVQHEWPVIEVIDNQGAPGELKYTFSLAAKLSQFIGAKVAA